MDVFKDSKFLQYFEAGKSEIDLTMKTFIYNSNEKLFELLDFDNEEIFSEPLLFSNLKQTSNLPLEQILYGYIEDLLKPLTIDVLTDKKGIVYIPKMGYFQTRHPNSSLKLQKEGETDYKLLFNNNSVQFDFYPSIYADNSTVEIYKYRLQQYEYLYSGPVIGDCYEQTTSILINEDLLKKVNTAFETIHKSCPDYYQILVNLARGIEFFNYETEKIYSFAGIDAHGVIFVNKQEDDHEIFIITEIAHQFAHCLLNTILFDKKEYFKIDFMTPMYQLSGVKTDDRSFFDAFHGLFTTFAVGYTLDKVLRQNIFQGEMKYELLGRFVDNHSRIYTGIEKCDVKKILTSKGLKLYNLIRNNLLEIYKDQEDLVKSFNISNQPFVFNYELFKTTNPLQ